MVVQLTVILIDDRLLQLVTTVECNRLRVRGSSNVTVTEATFKILSLGGQLLSHHHHNGHEKESKSKISIVRIIISMQTNNKCKIATRTNKTVDVIHTAENGGLNTVMNTNEKIM